MKKLTFLCTLALSMCLCMSPAFAGKPVDADGDGYTSNKDCNDSNPDVWALNSCGECAPESSCGPTGSHANLTWSDWTASPPVCLSCHNTEYNDMFGSTHYKWLGDAPDMVNGVNVQQGKLTNAVNSYCINIEGDWPICGKCHVGRGVKPGEGDTQANIDCLACHSEEYAMQRTRLADGSMGVTTPTDSMVQNIHKPTRANCLKCHANAGGGNGVKRGDLSMATIDNTSASFDVHMNSAGANVQCRDCHTFINHKTIGKGSDLRPTDDVSRGSELSCSTATCHPGWDSGGGHVSGGASRGEGDRHIYRVSCQACHVDEYAKVATETHRDWRIHHDGTDATTCDATNPCPGGPSELKAANLQPEMLFWNRLSDNYLLGDDASRTYDPVLGTYPTSRPIGDITDGKLTPFKYKTATQPMGSNNKLIALDTFVYLHGSQTGNVIEAVESGIANMQAAGIDMTGESYATTQWVNTDTYQMINHGVAPAASVDCAKCHGNMRSRLDPTTDSKLDALGYKLKDVPALICSQCHAEKTPKTHESMHNHINKGSGIGCYFCHDVARPERNLSSPCDPAAVAEFVDNNPYPHTCPEPNY